MKLTPHILTTTIALLAGASFAAEPAEKNAPAEAGATASSNATVTTSGKGGKATVTIDVNGKKETREIEFGDGTEVKVTTEKLDEMPVLNIERASGTAGQPKAVTWLGVAPEEVSEEVRAQLPLEPGTGLIVRTVLPDSPAAKAGLQKNDVLMKIDDQLLTNPSQLRTLVSAKKDGDTVKLTYFRRGQQATLDVKLATHGENPALNLKELNFEWPKLGPLLQLHSKSVLVDKDGKVIVGEQANLDATVEKIAKTLRDVGVDERIVAEATRALAETTNRIRDAVSDADVAKEEVRKGSSEIARALEQVRAAIEKVSKQTEEAVKKERENRREQKRP